MKSVPLTLVALTGLLAGCGTSPFNRDPEVAAWMAENGLNASGAYGYFTQRVGAMAKAQGRRVVQWAEVYANVGTRLDKSSIVHIWRSPHIARTPASAWTSRWSARCRPRRWRC